MYYYFFKQETFVSDSNCYYFTYFCRFMYLCPDKNYAPLFLVFLLLTNLLHLPWAVWSSLMKSWVYGSKPIKFCNVVHKFLDAMEKINICRTFSLHLRALCIFTSQVLLTLRLLMSYIYRAPILDVSRSHTTTQHSR